MLREYPSFATFVGDHRFDDLIEDLSAAGEQRLRRTLSGIRERVEAVDQAGLETNDTVTLALLESELSNAISDIDNNLVELASDQMQGVHAGLLHLAAHTNAPDADSATKLVTRYSRFGEMLMQGVDRFRDGLAKGRTPARVNIERSLRQLDGYLESPIDSDPFATMQSIEWDGEAEWRESLREVVETTVRPGFAEYREVLATELLPVARPNEKPGLCWIPDGEALYDTLISIHTSLSISANEVHEIGMAELTEQLPARIGPIGQRLFGSSDPRAIVERLRSDANLRYDSSDEIMAKAELCVAHATKSADGWFGRLPDAECIVTPIPDFLADDSPAAFYFPPAADGSRPGTYFVNLANPGDKARYESETIAFHEAIPGHHLQVALAAELEDIPAFRRHSTANTAYVEGWGLYAEHLADEMGMFTGDLDRIGMVGADAWRAARLVVDTGIHALGWSREQGIDFMTEWVPMSVDEMAIEVDRYIGMPAQALSYKIGHREISALRTKAESELGDRFDIKSFHDSVLGSGAVTLPILGTLIDDYIARAGRD